MLKRYTGTFSATNCWFDGFLNRWCRNSVFEREIRLDSYEQVICWKSLINQSGEIAVSLREENSDDSLPPV